MKRLAAAILAVGTGVVVLNATRLLQGDPTALSDVTMRFVGLSPLSRSNSADEALQNLHASLMFPSLPDLVVVASWTPEASTALMESLRTVPWARVSETFSAALSDPQLIKLVVSESRAIMFDPERLSDATRSRAEAAASALVTSAIERREPKRDTVVVEPAAVFMLPFVAAAARASNVRVAFVVAAQNGADAAFAASSSPLLPVVGPWLAPEEHIDKLCLMRLRNWTLLDTTAAAATPASVPSGGSKSAAVVAAANAAQSAVLDRVHVAASVKRNTLGADACRIDQDNVMRAAQVWTAVHASLLRPRGHAAAAALNLGFRGVVVAAEDFVRSPQALQRWQDRPATRANHEAPPSVALLRDLWWLLDGWTLVKLGYEAPRPEDATAALVSATAAAGAAAAATGGPAQPDARFCERVPPSQRAGRAKPNVAVARCLPGFLIVGAQKAGTDELAVWLNQNLHLRRLDGGVEIHFFDCLGRGAGWRRPPCTRARVPAMRVDSHAALPDVEAARAAGYPRAFSWAELRERSPYISDWWRSHYLDLGNVHQAAFAARALTFEKSPAYMDLADPRDVARLMPGVRLVFMLRDPARRFVSSYFQTCAGMYHEFANCSFLDLHARFKRLRAAAEDPDNDDAPVQDTVDTQVLRALQHGMYAHWLTRWRAAFPDEQILVIFAEHFREAPQAVVYALESFVGLTADAQHRVYEPQRSEAGLWVLGSGDYSKARKPSHQGEPPRQLTSSVKDFFGPWNKALAELLLASDIVYRPLQPVPKRYNGDFRWPKWLASA